MSSKWLPRYMVNPSYKDPRKEVKLATKAWLENEAQQLLDEITSKSPNESDLHGGAYTGGAGIAYALYKASSFPLKHSREETLKFGRKILLEHLESAQKKEPDRESYYLLGSLSVYVIFIILEKESERSKQLIDRVIEIGRSLASKDVPGDGDDELLAGRAGFLAAVLTLRQHLGSKVIPEDCIKAVMNTIVASGRSYAASKGFHAPLMYHYHGRHYLGAAHGLMEFMDSQTISDVIKTVDWIVSLQLTNGNFPSKLEDEGIDRGENELVHWCHGATGAVHLLITAYLQTQNSCYLKSANKALGLIWRKGVLLKGRGICHGAAGSGYAFLLIYRLTGKKDYLDYARCIARVFCSEDYKQRARIPDRPYSLFEGIGGTLCFLCDLMEPTKAQFPLVPIPFHDWSVSVQE